MIGEQIGRDPHHDFAVFQHVGHARRRADVVLQHVEVFAVGAHHVDAGDMHADVVGRAQANHLGPELRVALDELARNDAGPQDFLRAIDVGQKGVQRLDPLDQAFLEAHPFRALDDARNDIERDQPLGRVRLAVDVEGDADAPEHHLGMAALGAEGILGRVGEPACDPLVA